MEGVRVVAEYVGMGEEWSCSGMRKDGWGMKSQRGISGWVRNEVVAGVL